MRSTLTCPLLPVTSHESIASITANWLLIALQIFFAEKLVLSEHTCATCSSTNISLLFLSRILLLYLLSRLSFLHIITQRFEVCRLQIFDE